jgi:hypothetical protein
MTSLVLGCSLICFVHFAACTSTRPAITDSKTNSAAPLGVQESEAQAQTRFGAEVKIERPVNLPPDVLRKLQLDGRNQIRLGKEGSPAQILASWFAASEIDLDGDEKRDLLVQAVEPRLLGANLVPFWIFRGMPNGYNLVLRVDTLSVELLRTKTRGCRDILSKQASARVVQSRTFAFDGRKYREHSSSTDPISPG